MSDWSSDVCSSDLERLFLLRGGRRRRPRLRQDPRRAQRQRREVAQAPAQPAKADELAVCERRYSIHTPLSPRGLAPGTIGVSAWRGRTMLASPLAASAESVLSADYRVARSMGPGNKCRDDRSEEHTSELQSLMRTSYAVF